MANPYKKGAIIACNFPRNETPDAPGPVTRPCLILGSFPNPKVPGETLVITAYGTTQKKKANLSFEISIADPEAIAKANLIRPTRFTLNRLRILPLTKEYFPSVETEKEVIGYLSADDGRQLAAYLDRIAMHCAELNFFRPRDAIEKGQRFDPFTIDAYMIKELDGLKRHKAQSVSRGRLYRRSGKN